MTRTLALALVATCLATSASHATDGATVAEDATIRPAAGVELSDFLWIKRPIVVFADTPADPRFIQQMQNIDARLQELEERDVVVLVDTDPAAETPARQKLRPRGFSIVLIGKDGQVKWRKPAPRDVRELNRLIDSMPMRQQEIRDRRLTSP